MTTLRALALCGSMLLAACFGGGDDDVEFDAPDRDAPVVDAPVDAPRIDAPLVIDAPLPIDATDIDGLGPTCDPLAADGLQGCNVGQKCTWLRVQEQPQFGRTTCVPDGDVALGNACVIGPVGETTGYDNCRLGGVCVTGVCRDICGFDGSQNAACVSGYSCVRYAGIFDEGGFLTHGACTPSCDPITQLRTDGTTCGAGNGCYLLVSSTETVSACANAGAVMHGQQITGPVFANSCVPGAQPRNRSGGVQITECGGLCRPADVTSTTNVASEGGVAPNSCAARWNAPAPDDPTQGESCRYWWAREQAPGLTPFSNTVGWCFPHAEFQYDTNNDQVPDAPWPRCVFTTTGDLLPPIGNPPHNDAEYFWCTALPMMFQFMFERPAPRLPLAQPRFDVLQAL